MQVETTIEIVFGGWFGFFFASRAARNLIKLIQFKGRERGERENEKEKKIS